MATINLEDAIKLAAADEFWAIRGKAIQGYASLEQSLSSLFAELVGTDGQTANIIFFRIHSADARNKILEKLFQKKFGEKYNLFRNSLFKQLGPIDRERNEVVHWNVINIVGSNESGDVTSRLEMKPPANWVFDTNSPRKTAEDMVSFMQKCDFYTRLLNCFRFVIGSRGDVPDDIVTNLEAMYLEPIVFPPPPDHQLYGFDRTLAIGPTHFVVGNG